MGLFSSKQKQSSTTTQNPYGTAQPFIDQSLGRYGSLATPEAYGGNWAAGLNPMQSGAWNNMYNNPYGNEYQQQFGGFGGDALQSMSNQMANPNEAFQYNQGTYDTTMQNLMPAMQGTYDAATRDNNRNLNWNQLPGLNMEAQGNGLQGNTKVGQRSDLAKAMTGDRNADIGASIYQNATNQANANAMSAGSQNLNAQQNMYGMGMNALSNANNINSSNLNLQNMAGAGQQGYDQFSTDMDRAQWDAQQQNPWLFEAQRLGALTNTGSAFGTTQNQSTSTSNPGLGNVAMQLGSSWLAGGGGNPFSGIIDRDGGGLSPVNTLNSDLDSMMFRSGLY